MVSRRQEAVFETLLSQPHRPAGSHNRKRSRLLAGGLCIALHAAILVVLLYQIGGGRQPGHGSKSTAVGEMEVNIAPERAMAPPQTKPAHSAPRKAPPRAAQQTGPASTDTGADGATKDSTSAAMAPSGVTGFPADYQERLYAHIASFRLYPPQARQEGAQGRVLLLFTMSRAGAVLDIQVAAGSGFPALDQAAIDTIERAQPLPAIPADIAAPLEVEIPVDFELPR